MDVPFNEHKDKDSETAAQLLQATDHHKLEKKRLKKKKQKKCYFGFGLAALAGIFALATGVLVWHFHYSEEKVTKSYSGSLSINDKAYEESYEDPSSKQFLNLASLASKHLKNIYSENKQLSKHFVGSTVQAFSEGYDGSRDSVVAYYISEFEVPKRFESSVDEAIGSMNQVFGAQHGRLMGRHGGNRLQVNNLMSGALDARMLKTKFNVRKSYSLTTRGGTTGTIQTPGFPDSSYTPSTFLEWRLRADPGYRLKLQFDTFHLEEDCEKDFIKVYNSLAPIEKNVMAEECGIWKSKEPLAFISSSNLMLLTLVTSLEDNFRGFRASYSQIPFESQECGGKLSGLNGTFTSPSFPSHYPPLIQCVWNIEVPKGKFVKVQFKRFSMFEPGQSNNMCPKDYIEINGNKLCGDKPDNTVVPFHTNNVEVKFNSDESYVGLGFSAEFEAFDPIYKNCTAEEFACLNGNCIPKTQKCNGDDDCNDGSDESVCRTYEVLEQCSEYTFKCRNNNCIAKLNPECDGVQDCEDGSDETNCQCGKWQYRSFQIVGGQISSEGEWPWQVSLHIRGTGHVCGASVINNQWLITAAHCVQDNDLVRYSEPEQWQAYLGLHVQGQINKWTITKSLKRIISHPDYDAHTYDNDIALMELFTNVTLNQHIWPICLPAPTHHFPAGDAVWITGWGNIRENGFASPVLQKAEIHVLNNTQCNTLMNGQITPNMLCAGDLKGGVDACQGDSGGPLSSIDSNERAFLTGVVSWGDGCARKNQPGVYTRVTKYRDWIKENTGV